MACRPPMTKHGTPLMPSRWARKLSACTASVSVSPTRNAKAAGHRDFGQHMGVADVAPVGEMRREQGLHHLRPAPMARGPAGQTVRVHRGGGAADALEAELQPLQPADRRDRGIEAPRTFFAAELAHHVVGARQAGARHVRVQQKRPPGDVGQYVRPPPQRAHQPAQSEIAPGTHQIVHHLDAEARVAGRENVHQEKPGPDIRQVFGLPRPRASGSGRQRGQGVLIAVG